MINSLGRPFFYFKTGRTFRVVLTKGCLEMCGGVSGPSCEGVEGETVVLRIRGREPRMLNVLQ